MKRQDDIQKQLAYQHQDYIPMKAGFKKRFEPAPKVKNKKATLLRLIGLYLQWRGRLALALLAMLASSVAAVLGPLCLSRAIDAIDIAHAAAQRTVLLQAAALLLLCYVGESGMLAASRCLLERISQNLLREIRQRLFVKLGRLPVSFFDRTSDGDIMSRMVNDADSISGIVAETTTRILSSLFTILGALVVMLRHNLTLTGVTLLLVPAVFAVSAVITKKSRRLYLRRFRALGGVNAMTQETIANSRIVKAFSMEQSVTDAFHAANDTLCRESVRANVWSGMLFPLVSSISEIGFAALIFLGGMMAARGSISVGTVVLFFQYSRQFARPLNLMASTFSNIQQSLASAERIFEILDAPEEPDGKSPPAAERGAADAVEFQTVTFAYDPGRPVLENVSFKARHGQTVAILGETGAGKTTILQLLLRFYRPQSGKILLFGQDLNSLQSRALSSCFSAVLQENRLVDGTAMENIRFGSPDAPDEEVIAAAKQALAHGFISRLPQGYDTPISASTLSQGEQQLIAIARAILRQAPILVLDEATSSVDTQTERRVQAALAAAKKDRTTLIVAHRMQTVRDADWIVMIENGAVSEQGTFEDLMKNNGAFRRMYTGAQ